MEYLVFVLTESVLTNTTLMGYKMSCNIHIFNGQNNSHLNYSLFFFVQQGDVEISKNTSS